MWLFTAQSCVCLDGMPQKLFHMFLVCKSDLHWHGYLLCTFSERRPCSCWTTSGLSFSSTKTKALHFSNTNRCASCFAWIFVVPPHDRSCPLVRPSTCTAIPTGVCASLGSSTGCMPVKSQCWLITNTASWQPAYVSSHANLTCFHAKILAPWTEKSAVVWAFPTEVGVLSSRVLLRCLFNLPFRHRWSWKLCPLLKTFLVVITPRRTKSFWAGFARHHRAKVCHACPRLESVFASASVAGHWRRVPACAHTCKGKTRGEHDHNYWGRRRRVPRFNSVSFL